MCSLDELELAMDQRGQDRRRQLRKTRSDSDDDRAVNDGRQPVIDRQFLTGGFEEAAPLPDDRRSNGGDREPDPDRIEHMHPALMASAQGARALSSAA